MENLKNIMKNLFNKKFTDDTITEISNILQEFADNNAQIPEEKIQILRDVDFNKVMIHMIDNDMIDDIRYKNLLKDEIDETKKNNTINQIKDASSEWAVVFNIVYNNEPRLSKINGMKTFMTKITQLVAEAKKEEEIKQVGGKTKKRKGKVGGKSKKKRGSRKR